MLLFPLSVQSSTVQSALAGSDCMGTHPINKLNRLHLVMDAFPGGITEEQHAQSGVLKKRFHQNYFVENINVY